VGTNTVELNRESSGEGSRPSGPELVVYYPALSVRFGVDFVIIGFMSILIGMLTAGSLWLLVLCANQLLVLAGWGWGDLVLIQDETSWFPVAAAGLALLPTTLLFCWFSVLAAVHCLRKVRRAWWLRLSSAGFAVNDRTFTARRYEWHEIDKFMLVAPSADIEYAVVAPPKAFAEAYRDGGTQSPVFRVGFHCSSGRRRKLATKLLSGLRGRDGTRVHGLVMGYWDRPFDEAVDLMNEWLAHYKAT
jgi:rhodanese-related sulfurtransferase